MYLFLGGVYVIIKTDYIKTNMNILALLQKAVLKLES